MTDPTPLDRHHTRGTVNPLNTTHITSARFNSSDRQLVYLTADIILQSKRPTFDIHRGIDSIKSDSRHRQTDAHSAPLAIANRCWSEKLSPKDKLIVAVSADGWPPTREKAHAEISQIRSICDRYRVSRWNVADYVYWYF